MGFPGGSVVKNQPANAGKVGPIPGSERSPGKQNGNLLQYSCLENSMDRGSWWAIVHGVAKNWTQLSDWTELNWIPYRATWVAQWIKNLPAIQETQVWSLGQEDPLEEGMAPHSSILAWRSPASEAWHAAVHGPQRVRHDWATELNW